jgi:transketolase
MRDMFIEALYERMATDRSIFFLAADFGAPSLDKVRAEFPDRFINVGIAEQNLVNVATGLANEGCTVYAYAIAAFLSMRAFEQIRVNLAISSQIRPVNVNLIGVGGGVSYQVSGPTHHCLEDIAMMRLLPNMMVLCPSDWRLAEALVDTSISVKAPKYFRFDGKPVPALYEKIEPAMMEDGFCELIRGDELCLVSTGFMTHRALKVAKTFGSVGVVDLFTLKPIREQRLRDILLTYRHVITLEEGFIHAGGLDSVVAKVLDGSRHLTSLERLGFDDQYVFDLGDRDCLHAKCGMGDAAILAAVQHRLGQR